MGQKGEVGIERKRKKEKLQQGVLEDQVPEQGPGAQRKVAARWISAWEAKRKVKDASSEGRTHLTLGTGKRWWGGHNGGGEATEPHQNRHAHNKQLREPTESHVPERSCPPWKRQ